MVSASELKQGMALRIQGQVYKVLEVEAKGGTAKLGGVVKTKLSNVATGRMWEPHFRPQERMEDLEVERYTMEFLFTDADTCTFMNPDNFEQVEIPRTVVGPSAQLLQPGMKLPVEFFEGQPSASYSQTALRQGLWTRHRQCMRNRTAPGRKRFSTTISRSWCRCSSPRGNLCAWTSEQIITWKECAARESGAHR